MSFLDVVETSVYYGKALILERVNVKIHRGEAVGIIGPNGAGKTTLLRAISGVVRCRGQIFFDGKRIDNESPSAIVRAGIVQCPEGRHLFPGLSVRENLEMGAYIRRDRAQIEKDMDEIYRMFPVLKERQRQLAGTLSGGEQQMLAIGRSLMAKPSLLMLDEPSTGLALLVRRTIVDKIWEIRRKDVTILLVEQDAQMAFEIADRVYVFEQGTVALEGPTREVAANRRVRNIYLGIA